MRCRWRWGEDRLFVSHRAEGGSALLRLESAAGGVRPEVVWQSRFLLNHLSSSVYLDGHLYGFHNAILKCVDAATGEPTWARRGFGHGSLIAVDNTLLVLADDGELAAVAATPEAYREIGRLAVLEGRSWTAPSAAGGRVYLRNHRQMASAELAAPGSAVARSAESTVPRPSAPVTPSPPSTSVSEGETDVDSKRQLLARLLAAHRRALGGVERLRRVASLRLTGRYTEVSVYGDFELLRQRPERCRFEHRRQDGTIVRAWDGAAAWWTHPADSPAPSAMPAGEAANLAAEIDFFGPLAEPGLAVELVGKTAVDSVTAWELEVTRQDPDGSSELGSAGSAQSERWFLDAESLLAIRRVSRV